MWIVYDDILCLISYPCLIILDVCILSDSYPLAMFFFLNIDLLVNWSFKSSVVYVYERFKILSTNDTKTNIIPKEYTSDFLLSDFDCG